MSTGPTGPTGNVSYIPGAIGYTGNTGPTGMSGTLTLVTGVDGQTGATGSASLITGPVGQLQLSSATSAFSAPQIASDLFTGTASLVVDGTTVVGTGPLGFTIGATGGNFDPAFVALRGYIFLHSISETLIPTGTLSINFERGLTTPTPFPLSQYQVYGFPTNEGSQGPTGLVYETKTTGDGGINIYRLVSQGQYQPILLQDIGTVLGSYPETEFTFNSLFPTMNISGFLS